MDHTIARATLIAGFVAKMLGPHKLDFGVPEAMWIIRNRIFREILAEITPIPQSSIFLLTSEI